MWKKIILVVAGIFSKSLALQDFGIFSRSPQIWDLYPECKADVDKMMNDLKNNEAWPLKILDASTKIPSGILTGHLVDFGNFDECLDSGGPFDTQHCFATILPSDKSINGIIGIEPSLLPSVVLRWSYCIPSSCPPIVLQSVLQEYIRIANVTVSESDCHSKTQKTLTTADYVGISIWGLFLSLTLFSTIYDVVSDKTKAKRNAWLISFSIYTNGRNLLKTEAPSETLLFANGLRFLSGCWVIFGHRFFFTSTSSLLNLSEFAQETSKVRSQFFIQGVLAVDTFLFLGGLLNSYHCLGGLEKLKKFPVFTYYSHRYFRITPALAAIVVMYATWYSLVGNGPVWEESTRMWKELCVENWWSTLLFINNYYNPLSQCAGQSWYLAVDMQLYWLSPLIIIPLWKRPRFGKILLWVLLILSTVIQFVIAFVYEFRMPLDTGLSSESYNKLTKYLYVPTHTRATPYLIGFMIGYFLLNLKKTNTKLVMSRGFVFIGWLTSTLVALSVIFGNFQFTRPLSDHPYNRWESSIYISLHRIGWGAVLGWIVIACYSKRGGIINSFLSWKLFMPMSKLTYCMFLTHMAIQQYQVGTARTPDNFQYFNQVHRYFGDLLSSAFAATVLSLVFESPVMILEKLATRKLEERDLKGEVNKGFQDDSNTVEKA